jgi:hypothetical protein
MVELFDFVHLCRAQARDGKSGALLPSRSGIPSLLLPARSRDHWAALWLLPALLAGIAHAQAGPPFRTDDPETPGNRHWEINYGWIGDRNPREGNYSLPDFDMNYGLGDRIQLKYELPIALHEPRSAEDGGRIAAGLGESLLGVKWRFYQRMPRAGSSQAEDEGEPEPLFSFSTYPQLSLNNPTSSVQRNVVPPGPQFLLPFEANARFGPLRVDGEAGYWFTNRNVPQSWIRGMIAGHEFSARTEAYAEIYDQQDANRVDGEGKQREATLGLGGRRGLNRRNSVLLLLMGGRSFQCVVPGNGQPSWIAYVGLQMLLGPEERGELAQTTDAAPQKHP